MESKIKIIISLALLLCSLGLGVTETYALDNSGYVALSRQKALFRKMDVIAHNIANANTTAFKSESILFAEAPTGGDDEEEKNKVSFTEEGKTVIDFTQGDLQRTGRALDVAIDGEGFFALITPEGFRYTRAGSFQIDAAGDLVNADGYQVQGRGGAIDFDETDHSINIRTDGTITVISAEGEQENRGRISVFKFLDQKELKRAGSSKFISEEPHIAAIPNQDYIIAHGTLERSNVNSIKELTKMIEVSRAVGGTSKFLNETHELRRRAISVITKQN